MNLSIVVAMAENRAIGIENTLPWHLPEDLKRFKALTMGHPMIMGRLTFESIGRVLPGRKTIVVTRNKNWVAPNGVLTASDIQSSIEIANKEASQLGVDSAMVVGGAKIYEQLMPLCDSLYVTEVHTSVKGDAFFPIIDSGTWCEVERTEHCSESQDLLHYSFVKYCKRTTIEF